MADRPRRRRVRHDIIMEILQNAKSGIMKTHIMSKVGLSFSQLEQYLSALKNAGFITAKNGTWKTTEKGFHVIEACKICQNLLDAT